MAEFFSLPSGFSPSFSEAMKITTDAGTWVLISGQVGVPLHQDSAPRLEFEQEVRTCFARIEGSLKKCGAALSDLVRMDVYLTDLSAYDDFARIRTELFPRNPPTSATVQVAGLLVNARIEISGIAYLKEARR